MSIKLKLLICEVTDLFQMHFKQVPHNLKPVLVNSNENTGGRTARYVNMNVVYIVYLQDFMGIVKKEIFLK